MSNIPEVTLNNGVKMPQIGFGVFQITDPLAAQKAVSDALAVGYRLIDTAAAYQNEVAVGKAIKASGLKREDIFVTSKLWVSNANYSRAKAGIADSLQKLDLDYLDLYLLHQPYGDVIGAWQALEEAYQAGKIRAIGVSNFYADQLRNLELTTKIQPAINQIEVNPWYQQNREIAANIQDHVQVEAWAPFAEGKNHLFTNNTLKTIGQKYHKSVGQVVLRWLLQRQIIVIPKSVHQERMKENLAILDFNLTPSDMTTIAQLNQHQSQFFDHRDPDTITQIFGSSLEELKS